jgi:NADPH:quinone reductase-like Zn-dependent oxidoreductase
MYEDANGDRGEMMARTVRFHEYGDASVLKIESLDVPPPGADEVQIDIKSIGFNRAEVMFRTHAYMQEAQFPSRLGFEAAGIVKTVGTSIASFKKGDVVSLIPPTDVARWGTYGELANVPARNLVKHPRNISFEEAAASWMQYVTAWGALIEQAKLTASDFVITCNPAFDMAEGTTKGEPVHIQVTRMDRMLPRRSSAIHRFPTLWVM